MIKKHWKLLLLTSILILLPMVAGVILWNQLPEQLPYHWNAAGEVDGWSSKLGAVFGMPLFLVALQWACVAATFADPKKANHSGKIRNLVFWIVPVLSIVMHTLVYAAALGREVRIEVVMPIFMGLLFVIIGNYMPKCKQNYTIGIKLPWTLHSEENWNRTHRVAGRTWVVCGLLMILTGFFFRVEILIAISLLMVLVPVVYSYLLYRKGI